MNDKRIAIIGAGPIGLEAALYARTLGYDVIVYDKGDVAANVRSWKFVTLFSPWEMNTTSLGWKVVRESGHEGRPESRLCPTAIDMLDKYLLPLAASRLLSDCIRTQSQVLAIGRDDYGKSDAIGQEQRGKSPFRLLVREPATGTERIDKADIVLDCSGVYGHHRWAGRGGVPAPGERALESKISYTLPDVLGKDRPRFVGRHTLVLGAGFSAATVLQGIEHLHRENPATKASWAIRRVGQAMQALHNDPLPARAALVKLSMKLAEQPPPWLQYLGNCVLERVEHDGESGKFGVTLRYMETDLALAVDEVVALVGYSPDNSIYEQLQIHQSYATAGPMKVASALLSSGNTAHLTVADVVGRETLVNPEPNFYILGAKSFGTNSAFLLTVGHRQVRDAFQLIRNDSSLDLYRPAP